jgi:hypothetical protein
MGSGVAKKYISKGRPWRKNSELGKRNYEEKKDPEENKNC